MTMMKSLVCVCMLIVLCRASFLSTLSVEEKQDLFRSFVAKHSKSYLSVQEEKTRFYVFNENLARIDALNANSEDTAEYGITKFADQTPEEFRVRNLMRREAIQTAHLKPEISDFVASPFTPSSVDWRTKVGQYMNGVRNQGQCGSCWAFSVAENIASVWAIAGNELITTSVQQIVDCDNVDQGCNGGDPPTAYKYVIQAGGLETEADYPYHATDGQCEADPSKFVAKISSWKYVAGSGETGGASAVNKMQTGVATQPLSICVEADTWQFYTGGVLSSNCGQQLDHCVILAGYDNIQGTDAWIVRNSWGTDWGVEGYIYVAMDAEKNLCGIQDEVTTAIV